MSAPKNGGSAFPMQASDLTGSYPPEPGMSLRAYFAGQVLPMVDARSHGSPADVAVECCQLADALIAELNKTA